MQWLVRLAVYYTSSTKQKLFGHVIDVKQGRIPLSTGGLQALQVHSICRQRSSLRT
jgi:hypothetical protein